MVVIPAYNEATTISEIVRALRGSGFRVVVVDDASSDDTTPLALAAGAAVLRHPVNLGQGAALRTGFRYVSAIERDAVVVTFDADGQHDPAVVAQLVAPVADGTLDVVLGSRFLNPDSIALIPPVRRTVLRCAVWLARRTTGLPLTDAHNGFRAIRLDALRRMQLVQDRMAHASELLSEIARLELRVGEVAVHVRYTAYSTAKGQRSLDAISVLWDLVLARFR